MHLFEGRLTAQLTIAAGHMVRVLFDDVNVAEGVRWITGENSNDYAVEGNCDGWVHLESVELPPTSPAVAQVEVVSGTARVRLSRDLDNEGNVVLTAANGVVTFEAVAEQANLVAVVVEAVDGDVVLSVATAHTIG